MKTYLWIRVSSKSQNPTYQREKLLEKHPNGIVIESRQSGASKKTNKDLMDLVDKCEKNDRIAAIRMSRIARSMKTLCDFFTACDEKGILVDILHEQFDTSTANCRLMMRMQMCLCAWNREIIREVADEGYKAYRDKGGKVGRPSSLDPEMFTQIEKLREKGHSYAEIAKMTRVSRSYVHRICNPEKDKEYQKRDLEAKKKANE